MPGGADNLTAAVYVYGSLHNIELAICDFPKKNGRQKVLLIPGIRGGHGVKVGIPAVRGWENHIETPHRCRVADVWIWCFYLPISCHCSLSLFTSIIVHFNLRCHNLCMH